MEYDIHQPPDLARVLLPPEFQGDVYQYMDNWLSIIPMIYEPRIMLEIGTRHGANACCLIKTYAAHPSSIIHCVDSWTEHDEHRTHQANQYATFIGNISKLSPTDLYKIHIHRGQFEEISPHFENERFDIIFICSNHTTRYMFESAIGCIKKIKIGGWLVIDHVDSNKVRDGIAMFIMIYAPYFEPMITRSGQLFMRKNDRRL